MWIQRLILVYVSWQFVKQIVIPYNLYYKMGMLEDSEQVLVDNAVENNKDRLSNEFTKIL